MPEKYPVDPETQVRDKYSYKGEPTPPTKSQDKIGPAPKGIGPWFSDLENDIRGGSGYTAIGRLLSKLGASGSEKGVAPGVASLMPGAGTIEGLAKAGHGATQLGSHPMRGVNEIVRGVG